MSNVNISWNPSVSTDVTKQVIVVSINDVEFSTTTLPVSDTGTHVGVSPGDVVKVELFAANEYYQSPPAIATYQVPTIPESPTELVITFIA